MYHSYLNTERAQKIADGIMKVIPYNIFIMDPTGVILATGDKEKIGKLHPEAISTLQRKETYVVYENSQTETRGINLPILYSNQIMGVIGIYGEPKEVMAAGQICMSIALLMIENQILNEMSAIKESRLKDFLYEWISLAPDQYTAQFIDQANYLGIDLKLPRTAVILKSRRTRFSVVESVRRMLRETEYVVRQGMEESLLLLQTDAQLDERLKKMMELSKDLACCYVGESHTVASKATHSVTQTMQAAGALGICKPIVKYQEVFLECLLEGVEVSKELSAMISLLREKDSDGVLRETVYAYMEDNDNYTAICDKLHVHRNTLNYRLAKIEELTGKNPRRAKELMLLYVAFLKMEGESPQP